MIAKSRGFSTVGFSFQLAITLPYTSKVLLPCLSRVGHSLACRILAVRFHLSPTRDRVHVSGRSSNLEIFEYGELRAVSKVEFGHLCNLGVALPMFGLTLQETGVAQ